MENNAVPAVRKFASPIFILNFRIEATINCIAQTFRVNKESKVNFYAQ